MAAPYRSSREHVDDILVLASRMFTRLQTAPGRSASELDLDLIELDERMEARLDAAARLGVPLPLDRLRTAFQLEATEQRCLWLLLAHALSAEVRALAGEPGVPLELLDAAVYTTPDLRDRFARELGVDGRLVGYALVEIGDHDAAWSRPVRIARRVIDLALGVDGLSEDVARFATLEKPSACELLVDQASRDATAAALRQHVEARTGPVPLLRGREGSGRRAIVAHVAGALEAQVLVVRSGDLSNDVPWRALLREAILHRAVLVFADAEALEDRARSVDALLASYPGPVALTANPRLVTPLVPARGTIVIDLPSPDDASRESLWRRHVDPALAADAASRYRLTPGQITRAALIARAQAGKGALSTAHVQAGVRAILDDKLAVLGTRVETHQSWDDLVLPSESLDELREMIARIRHQRRVLDEWGLRRMVGRAAGVAALFSGPPGTGKTMAAGLVARELGLDLYQIDLSRIVSKYVGETEKNLANVFDAAESGHAVLLFDEADSLFAKRTEVKSSIDRYANLEVNYLLQRMESFSGITILTTNFDAAIDEAFRRRLALRIAFPLPGLDERAQLWRVLLPQIALARDVDFATLAAKYAMSGGYIKNAALRAAFLAAADETNIEMRHLLRAASAEYAAMGKVVSSHVR